jgi:hypothetical protein
MEYIGFSRFSERFDTDDVDGRRRDKMSKDRRNSKIHDHQISKSPRIMRIFVWLFLLSSAVVFATESPRVEAITRRWKSYFVDEDAFETSHMDLSTMYDSLVIESGLSSSNDNDMDDLEKDRSSSIPCKYKRNCGLSSHTDESKTDDKLPSVQNINDEGFIIMRNLETRRENMRCELEDIKRRMEGVIDQGCVGEGAIPFTSKIPPKDTAASTLPRKVVVSVEI